MRRKVSLLDLDAEKRRRMFPNLALMKISAAFKRQGWEVFLNFPLCNPDLIYASCVFTWHKPKLMNPSISYGGSGIDYQNTLPDEIEHIMPDYRLYPNCDFSMGFTSRGCPNKCPFCIVPLKEGGIKAHAKISEFYNPAFKKLLLLDNNILAAENWDETADELTKLPVEVDFNQGLDIRRIDNKIVKQLRQMKIKVLRFAFDDISYEYLVRQGIELLLSSGIRPRKISFYVLVGFRKDDKAIERIKLLQRYGVEVYPMIYRDNSGKEPKLHYDSKEIISFHGVGGNNFRRFLRIIGRLA